MKMHRSFLHFASAALFLFLPLAPSLQAADRDVQIAGIDFIGQRIELRNCGDAMVSLDGWRFCTHNHTTSRVYTRANGLNGQSLGVEEHLIIHLNNDAPAGGLNGSAVGNFAASMSPANAWAIGLYNSSSFNAANALVDHLQWSPGGVDNPTADERSTVAADAGLWTADNEWISTMPGLGQLALADPGCGRLHGPDSYVRVDARVKAWWRFERQPGTPRRARDISMHIPSVQMDDVAFSSEEWMPAVISPLRDPLTQQTFANRFAFDAPAMRGALPEQDILLGSNWTVETIVSLVPDAAFAPLQLIGSATGRSFDVTNSLLGIGVNAARMQATLRDDRAGMRDTFHFITGTVLPADGHFHHLAWVKSGMILIMYLDYQEMARTVLSELADGSFAFRRQDAQAAFGIVANGALHIQSGSAISELRVTADSLEPLSFLRIACPKIRDLKVSPSNQNVQVDVLLPADNPSDLEDQASMSPTNAWNQTATMTNNPASAILTVPAGTNSNRFFRMRQRPDRE